MDKPSPQLARFVTRLEAYTPGRHRIPLAAYTAAFLAVEPAIATDPDRRTRLWAALTELIAIGVIRWSHKVDRTELPALPCFLVLLTRIVDPPVDPEAARFPWRPELVWARRLPLRRSEFDALKAIQLFLRDRAASAPMAPLGERSLQIFGDEKKLDGLRKNRRLFAPGRLSLDSLKAKAYAPPFAYRKVGEGPVALVLENVATYHSVLALLRVDSPVGLVIFGGGTNFVASVAYLAELAADGVASQIRHIRYFGDLDRAGLQIPMAADRVARELGLPPVLPAVDLWTRLVRQGTPGKDDPVGVDTARQVVRWLPEPLRANAATILTAGRRIAQESVGTEELMKDGVWASSTGLGVSPSSDGQK
jgi:hypothetical protein